MKSYCGEQIRVTRIKIERVIQIASAKFENVRGAPP